MRKILIISILLLVLFLTGCGSDIPSWLEKVGQLKITQLDTAMKDYGVPYFYGTVKSTGNIAVYNVSVKFKIYETAEKKNIIDTANGFPASGSDIEVGESATFEAVAFSLDSVDDLQYYNYEITFLEK